MDSPWGRKESDMTEQLHSSYVYFDQNIHETVMPFLLFEFF